MDRRIYFFGAFIIFILVSGCGEGQQQVGPNYHSGTQGITMQFLQNSPSAELFDGDSAPFVVEIKNLGADTTSPKFWLGGHDENIVAIHWSGTSSDPSSLQGKDQSNPMGEIGILSSTARISLPPNVDTYSTNMKLTTCYDYKTYATAQICIDPDRTNNQDDACTAQDISLGGGQGGPVAVTNIDEGSSLEKVRFTLTIQNVGDGTIVNNVDTCTNLRPNEIDSVSVSATLSGRPVLCRPDPLRLVGGKGYVYCEINQGSATSAFTTVLSIELGYGYKSSISKSINVRRI